MANVKTTKTAKTKSKTSAKKSGQGAKNCK